MQQTCMHNIAAEYVNMCMFFKDIEAKAETRKVCYEGQTVAMVPNNKKGVL